MGKLKETSFLSSVKHTIKCFLIAVLLGVFFFIAYAFYTGTAQVKIQNFKEKITNKTISSFHTGIANAGFIVDEIMIEGHKYTKRSELEKAISWEDLLGESMSVVDVQKIKQNIQRLPWIKNVSVIRLLPNILSIRIEEKKPIALFQKDGKHMPLDENGEIIKASAEGLSSLIICTGEDAPRHAPELIKMLAFYPEISKRALSAVRIGKRRWNLILDDLQNGGMTVYLPSEGLQEALKRLDDLNKTEKILSKPLSLIDLRFQDKLIVRTLDNMPETSIGIQPFSKEGK